jgi:hypothetical protein
VLTALPLPFINNQAFYKEKANNFSSATTNGLLGTCLSLDTLAECLPPHCDHISNTVHLATLRAD